jgi:hypothetical protein
MEKIKFELRKAEYKGVSVDNNNFTYELYLEYGVYDLFVIDNTKSDPEDPYRPLIFKLRARKSETVNEIVSRYKPEEFFMREKIEEIQSLYDVECGIW